MKLLVVSFGLSSYTHIDRTVHRPGSLIFASSNLTFATEQTPLKFDNVVYVACVFFGFAGPTISNKSDRTCFGFHPFATTTPRGLV